MFERAPVFRHLHLLRGEQIVTFLVAPRYGDDQRIADLELLESGGARGIAREQAFHLPAHVDKHVLRGDGHHRSMHRFAAAQIGLMLLFKLEEDIAEGRVGVGNFRRLAGFRGRFLEFRRGCRGIRIHWNARVYAYSVTIAVSAQGAGGGCDESRRTRTPAADADQVAWGWSSCKMASVEPAQPHAWKRYFSAQDVLWVLLFTALAFFGPERTPQAIPVLSCLAIFQIVESKIPALATDRGNILAIVVKLGLGYVLILYTRGIESSYLFILLLPIISAATTLGLLGTTIFIILASGAYLSFLLLLDWQRQFIPLDQIPELLLRVAWMPLAGFLTQQLAKANRLGRRITSGS